jgi:YbbR domain-containing protein
VDALPGYIETEAIDLSGLSDDMDLRVPLKIPAGVELAGEESVLVRLNVAAIEGSLPITLPVEVVGLGSGLEAKLSPSQVDVLISGPVPLLKAIKPTNLRVVVDLSGMTNGEYQVPPIVDLLPNSVNVASILPANISVLIQPIGGGTIAPPSLTTQTATPPLAPSQTPSPTASKTASP